MPERADVAAIDRALRAVADPERAAGEKRYLKSDLDFYGVRVPVIRSIVRAHLRDAGPPDAAALRALVERLVREAGTWALVDPLAILVAGGLRERFPDLDAALGRWAADGDFWLRPPRIARGRSHGAGGREVPAGRDESGDRGDPGAGITADPNLRAAAPGARGATR